MKIEDIDKAVELKKRLEHRESLAQRFSKMEIHEMYLSCPIEGNIDMEHLTLEARAEIDTVIYKDIEQQIESIKAQIAAL